MKKRRAWWIVGGFVVTVALFGAWAFLAEYNSTDARIERAVAQIVEEYGFELQYQLHEPKAISQATVGTVTFFERAPLDEKAAGEIVAILREACPSCRYEDTGYDTRFRAVLRAGGDPWKEVYNFNPKEQKGGRTAGILFSPNHRGVSDPESGPEAILVLSKFDRPSLWQRIKGLWPW